MTRKEILENAMRCVGGDRDEQYGEPENSFQAIAMMWSAYVNAAIGDTRTNIIFGDRDVAAMMSLVKIARIATGVQKCDNWVDLAGYAACGGELDSPPMLSADQIKIGVVNIET